jgi:UV DNA damage endonuclease
MIRLGLCCINTELRKKDIFCSRTMIRKNFSVKKAKELSLKNIQDIEKMAEWNYKNNIFVFRISSDIFPHFTDNETEPYTIEFALDALKQAGDVCKKYNQRITMHPGQFNQVGAKDEKVFENTIKDLKMHADILDAMGMNNDSVICVHGGGVYGNIKDTTERWIKQFSQLPDNVQRRLAIENCERCYNIIDCLKIAEECNIPLIFDCHHYDCYNIINKSKIDINQYMDRIVNTWKRRDIRPLFHISEQRKDARIGTHSDFIEKLPEYYLSFPQKYGDLDIEIEAKLKEQAIFKLYKIYPFLLGGEFKYSIEKDEKEIKNIDEKDEEIVIIKKKTKKEEKKEEKEIIIKKKEKKHEKEIIIKKVKKVITDFD